MQYVATVQQPTYGLTEQERVGEAASRMMGNNHVGAGTKQIRVVRASRLRLFQSANSNR
jgi:hypothetical protein